jgi:hypothetical protein
MDTKAGLDMLVLDSQALDTLHNATRKKRIHTYPVSYECRLMFTPRSLAVSFDPAAHARVGKRVANTQSFSLE